MTTVALIGADGAGKTTVGRRVEEGGALRIKYLYMGVNAEASSALLPTTRAIRMLKRLLGRETDQGGPPDRTRLRPPPRSMLKRSLRAAKAGLRTINLLGEEWFRQSLAWYYQCRGYTVLFDRHFYWDYFAHDIDCSRGGRSLSRRIHGFILDKVYPKPDLVILLDAPARVLFDRKPEGTVELIESRRQEYFQLKDRFRSFAVVNADQPLESVTREVLEVIGKFHSGGERSQ